MMLKDYFLEINKKTVKKTAAKKAASKKTTSKKVTSKGSTEKIDIKYLTERISSISPSNIKVGPYKPIDQSGFSPEGADLIAYENYCEALPEIFNNYIPFELIKGAYFFVEELSKTSLAEVLNRVSTVKRINRFVESENSFNLPSFIVAGPPESYSLLDIKNDLTNYYISKSVESESEFEILAVINYGIIVKDWNHGARSFIALETAEDTLMWLFVLMNEYLDIEREESFDLRSYIKNEKVYNEY